MQKTTRHAIEEVTSQGRSRQATSPIRVASLNADLIGSDRSRWMLSTPALILDLDLFEQNILRMKAISEASGIALRPHAKAHKCSTIAHRQMEAGARGVCCATLDEAAAMAAAGITNLLVTSPAAGERKVQQLIEVAASCPGIMVAVDHRENVSEISGAARAAGLAIGILIDIDPGLSRTGVTADTEVLPLARLVDGSPNLKFCGIQCYGGNLQFIEDRGERAAGVEALARRLAGICSELSQNGLKPSIVSGGGTGTAELESARVFTELQVGSYLFMDGKYSRVLNDKAHGLPFEPALFVSSTVVNSHRDGQSTIDAGTKAIVNGWSPPQVFRPADAEVDYEFAGDEHGRLIYRHHVNKHLEPGDRVELFVPHCDPNVDLFAFYHCVRGDRLVDIWPIDARSNR